MKVEYAGFWLRLFASIVDSLIFLPITWFLAFLFGINLFSADAGIIFTLKYWILILAGFIIGWFYYALMESSEYQGTVGKIALGIKVTDMDGKRVSFGRASARFFGKYVSMIVLYIGYLMIAFTGKKQGLHDMIAKTLVVKK